MKVHHLIKRPTFWILLGITYSTGQSIVTSHELGQTGDTLVANHLIGMILQVGEHPNFYV